MTSAPTADKLGTGHGSDALTRALSALAAISDALLHLHIGKKIPAGGKTARSAAPSK